MRVAQVDAHRVQAAFSVRTHPLRPPDRCRKIAVTTPLLETVAVAKRYGSVVALRSANLTVNAGEIHALLGANGAGKSTLVKILTGVIQPTDGEVRINGGRVVLRDPVDAQRRGMAPVFQDPALVPDLTVADNLRLTAADPDSVRQWLDLIGLSSLDLNDFVRDIALPQLRMLDLARAVSRQPSLLILDEITAALPKDYADRVIDVMTEWKNSGRAVLFISHRLAEVDDVCDVATVLRDGCDVDRFSTNDGGQARMVRAMLGDTHGAGVQSVIPRLITAKLADHPPMLNVPESGAEPEAIAVTDVRVGQLQGITFAARRGEVLGIAALEGQGQDLLFEVLSGNRRPTTGELRVNGERLVAHHPADAIRRGVVLVPSDRLHALLPKRSVRENLAIPFFRQMRSWGPVRRRTETTLVHAAVARLSIDTRAQSQVRRLSGGNQQKVTIGRWLTAGFDVLLCFDPTRGIDVGTKQQIYDLVRELAASGKTVILFTSELREIALCCDRVVVIYEGRITAEMSAADADEERLLNCAHGLVEQENTTSTVTP